MLFGDLIAQLADEIAAEEALLRFSDLPLLAELRAQAEANGLELGTYTAAAVNRYASEATDEEWVSLIGAIGRAHDPGVTYLKRALAYTNRRTHG
jgi:Tfp pilus assembly protein FimV